MEFLSIFQDASRFIEAQVAGFEARAKEVLEREIEELKADISERFSFRGTFDSNWGQYLTVEHDGDSITLYLPFHIGLADSRGREIVSAQGKHNPGSEKFVFQPFQDALEERGYTEISPARGEPISETDGKTAPNVRISAKLPDRLIREITGGI